MTRHRVPGFITGSGSASEIAPGLLQGGFPNNPERLAEEGIDVIVLSAVEFQPEDDGEDLDLIFPGVEVIAVPLVDDAMGPTTRQMQAALEVASQVVQALEAGKTVFVSCAMGWNRSGLINALALTQRYGMSGSEAVSRVRTARPRSLSNKAFVAILEKIPAKGRRG